MAVAVNDAVKQVLARLGEDNASPIAELPAGTGSASSATITTADQIIKYLIEAQNYLARTPLLEIRGTSTASVASGTSKVSQIGLTTSPTTRQMWRIHTAQWTITTGSVVSQLRVAEWPYYEIYYRTPSSGTPLYVFDGMDHALMGPTPDAAGTLLMRGLLLPKTLASGGDIEDVPAELCQHLYAFACWRVCEQNAAEPALAEQLPLWRSEIMPWAAPFIGGK